MSEIKEKAMPDCKKWRNIDTCGGHLIKSGWLPSSGEDSRLREYECAACGDVLYMKTGRLGKVKGAPKEGVEQPTLI